MNEGSQVSLQLEGNTLTVQAQARPRYNLIDLMAEMPDGLPKVSGWDEMPSVGLEES